jgi:hypothetical protein
VLHLLFENLSSSCSKFIVALKALKKAMGLILQCLAALSIISLAGCQGAAGIQTTSGKIVGMKSAKVATVSQFLGIPFAQPPTGSRRWLKPQDYNSTGEIKAVKQAACGLWL